MTPGDWSAARRVLAVRVDAAGDVLMTSPALRALHEGGPPGTEVTLLTSPTGAHAGHLVPEVARVIAYEAPWMKPTVPLDAAAHFDLVERLRAARYDGAVIFTVHTQSALPAALLCFLAGIPRRLAHVRENPYHLLTDWVPEIEPHEVVRHEVQRQLDLVATVGRRPSDEHLRLSVPAEAMRWARTFLATHRLAAVPWCVLHVGASAPSRRYPPERFAEVARALAGHGWRLVFTGSEEERPLVDAVRDLAAVDSLSLCGALDFPRLAALIEAAPLLISNNTAPAHIAAAVQTPVVDLYALTNPQHTPWRVPARVLSNDVPCRDCYRSVCPLGHQLCLAGVPPEAVVEAALDLAPFVIKGAARDP
ncbi:MAG: glycosyltransferase family 9 protein [Dehalococcoidia bacterium]